MTLLGDVCWSAEAREDSNRVGKRGSTGESSAVTSGVGGL